MTDKEMDRRIWGQSYYKNSTQLAPLVNLPVFDDHYISDKFFVIRTALQQSDGEPVKVRIPRGKVLDVLRAMLLDVNVVLELDHDLACSLHIGDACTCRSPGSAWYRATWQGESSTPQ